jgi:trimethylamine:corrinoid methyltransferase-like protein
VLTGFRRRFPPVDVLSEEDPEAIHRGALFVLETTGMKVEHERALKLFAAHDCTVDFEENRVRMTRAHAGNER